MIRATTGGVLKSYRSNLMNSFIRMGNATNTVLTQRVFNSYAEDPASASKAFQLRRSYLRTENQKSTNSAMIGKYEVGGNALISVLNMVNNRTENSAWNADLRAANDPTGDARLALGKVVGQLADSIVETMNSKYGANFIFAGADGLNVPFEMTDAGLTYRGVLVDSAVPDVITDNGDKITVNDNGQIDTTATGTNYLLKKDAYTMSQEDYEAATSILEDSNGEVRVNADGKMDTNGEYRVLNKRTELVVADSIDPADSNAYILRDENGDAVEVDKDGNIAQKGGYYLSLSGNLIDNSYTAPTLFTDENGDYVMVDENGNPSDDGEYYLAVSDALISKEDYDKAAVEAAKLDYMSSESYYVDIGLGFQWNDDANKLFSSSGFDAALQGINFLGYGIDEDGDPKNLVSILNRMADILNNYSTEAWSNGGEADFNRLMGKLNNAAEALQIEHNNKWAATTMLNDNYDRLDDDLYTLKEQYGAIEDVDMAEALTDFLWAQYCYNAALKMGNSILSPSLMDYLS